MAVGRTHGRRRTGAQRPGRTDGKGANGKGANGKGANGKGANGKGANGKGANGKGANGAGASRRDGHGTSPETEALHRAADQCHAAFSYCATEAHDIRSLEDLLCLVDCAELCTVTAVFLARRSPYSDELRVLCLQQCMDSARTCEQYPDDEVLRALASILQDACDALSVQAEPAE